MKLYKRLWLIVGLAVLSLGAWFVGEGIYTWRHVPEAYAAWDAGLLLVRHLEKNQGDWPDSWSDLEQLYRDEPEMRLYWNPHEPDYFARMRDMIKIDWQYDTENRTPPDPVKSPDGTPLVCLWANPNSMVINYLDSKLRSKSVTE